VTHATGSPATGPHQHHLHHPSTHVPPAGIDHQPACRASSQEDQDLRLPFNGTSGDVVTVHGSVCAVIGLTVVNGKIAALGVLAGPERLRLPGVEVLN
jgi:hypothetical protein